MVTLDFKLGKLSLALGEFITGFYGAYPTGQIKDVSSYYPYSKDFNYVSITAPEDIAVLIKLRFINEYVDRPKIEENLDSNTKKEYISKLNKKYYDLEDSKLYYKQDLYKKEYYNSYSDKMNSQIKEMGQELLSYLKSKTME